MPGTGWQRLRAILESRRDTWRGMGGGDRKAFWFAEGPPGLAYRLVVGIIPGT
jgi:hypothetical protein